MKKLGIVLLGLAVVVLAGWVSRSHIINLMMPEAYRPEPIEYTVEEVYPGQFDEHSLEVINSYDLPEIAAVAAVALESAEGRSQFKHIERFRESGITSYEGPGTCLSCHEKIRVSDGSGGFHRVDLRENLTGTSHFTFAAKTGFSTYGFNGEKVDNFALGKINRACGIPGSFTWTGWAVEVDGAEGQQYSEGCGQCHIVGQYGPISGTMMPAYEATDAEFAATDCLICHSAAYDMNFREVVTDPNGKSRWGQDRQFITALSVRKPTSEECLRCHQHNLGGDTYEPNPATAAPGYNRQRIVHPGAKRGTPYGADWDVHAAAGMDCIDCHTTQGHKIARGTRGVDLVANDLPGVEVSCEKCHTAEPHQAGAMAAIYNVHTEKIACETCHIPYLYPDNLVYRDWANPVFDEHEGIWVPANGPFDGEPGGGITYRWFNGNGTFMANALGDNPNGEGLYKALNTTPNTLWAGSEDFDYDGYYEEVFRPIAREGESKIWPFKRFQAVMFEDLNNQGPFGGMLLPFDYKVYYETGDPVASVQAAAESPIMQKMYGGLFKWYMMDQFMEYMVVDGWDTNFSMDRIASSPMRNEATLMINHAISKDGRGCSECHSAEGILDFDELGYSPERARVLRSMGF